jgi:hypothetical protein
MTNARLSVDIAITKFRIASDSARLLSTPAEEIALALRPDPRPAGWLDPCFGTLYLVTNDANGLIRIGCADRLRKRYTDMNVTSPVQLTIAHFVHLVGMPVAKQVELDLHTTLLAYRRRGEWFEVDLDAAATQAIADADGTERRMTVLDRGGKRRLVGALRPLGTMCTR